MINRWAVHSRRCSIRDIAFWRFCSNGMSHVGFCSCGKHRCDCVTHKNEISDTEAILCSKKCYIDKKYSPLAERNPSYFSKEHSFLHSVTKYGYICILSLNIFWLRNCVQDDLDGRFLTLDNQLATVICDKCNNKYSNHAKLKKKRDADVK